VHVEISPEPSEPEREAILAALERERQALDEVTLWWRAGVEQPEEEGYATAPPHQSRGVTRA
jgi:hypothetical protein